MWVCLVLEEVAEEGVAGAEVVEGEVAVLEELVVYEAVPADVAVAPVERAVAIDHGVVECVVGSSFSPPCDRKISCDYAWKSSS